MKKIILSFFTLILFSSLSFGQSFSDDFESYSAGDWLGSTAAQWTTWSGNTGGADDVRVSDEDASSGTNSIKLGPSAAGGPEDVVLYFTGDKITSGQLNMNMMMRVKSAGYFNYQAETAIGVTWAMDLFFEANGKGSVTAGGVANTLTFDYPADEWFNVAVNVNLDANKWQVFIDGGCVGSFANPTNTIASIDIFPRGGDEFFVDDFAYTYVDAAPPITKDASATLNVTEELGLVGTKTSIIGTLANLGTETITSFDVEAVIGSQTIPFSQTGINLAAGESMDFDINTNFAMPEGVTTTSINILSVNGGAFDDQDQCNDAQSRDITAVVPAPNKKIVVEEATGTWCGWCPRGTVALEKLTYKYPERFIGIAVHDNDPMADTDYDSGLGATAFPNAKVDRGAWMNPANVEGPFIENVQTSAVAKLENGAEWNADTRELKLSLTVTATEDISTGYKVNMAITEDGVTGTGNGWAQANYYSGGSDLFSLDGTNWADLPDPVPANQSVYDHVARAILAPFSGLPDSFTETLATDGEKTFNFTYTIPAEFDETKMHIVSMIIAPNGTINNGEAVTITEAIENGYTVSATHDIALGNSTSIYPNPFSNTATVSVNLEETADVNIRVVDLNGRVVMMKDYAKQSGFFNIQFDGSSLNAGVYVMQITANDKFTSKRISIIK